MEIINFQTTEKDGTFTEHIQIDLGDGAFMTMLKFDYDALQAEESTPSLENGTIS